MPASDFPARQVTLLLSDRTGAVLGALPPFEVEVPWWQEVGDVVAGARENHGVDVTVLRLLDAETGWGTAGGAVTYLAEVDAAPEVDLALWIGPDPTVDHPFRLPYARPGGPAADLAWADEALAAAGRERTSPAEQVRTWNLSSVWRLPTADGPAWLKVVPPFFAHEGAMLRRLDPQVVPPLIAADGPRVLMADAPGEDHWGAELHVLERLVTMLVGLQAAWVDRLDELEQVGAPDWRAAAFVPAARAVLAANSSHLEPAEVESLQRLVDDLPDRFVVLAECGIPDTFVHGDFHPGNAHGSPDPDGRSVLLDWGDVGIGNPLLDQAATITSVREEQRAPLRAHWSRLWREAVPGCDPDRASELLGPVRGFRQAMIYQLFLDSIEPDERVYHSGDPALWLRRAAELSG